MNNDRYTHSKPFSNGSELDFFNANFCCRCDRYKLDHDGVPCADNCEIEDRISRAMFDDQAWPAEEIVVADGTRVCTGFHCADPELMEAYKALLA